MRNDQSERYYQDDERQGGWREPNRRFESEDDFGSPHDQGEPPRHFRAGSQPGYERRGREQRGAPRRQYGGSEGYREPYETYDSDDYGYRPEPRFERQYRESYRPEYEQDRPPRETFREERREWRGGEGPGQYREEGERGWRGEQRRYENEPYQGRRMRREERGNGPEYTRREPRREEERRGPEEYYSGPERSSYRRQSGFREERGSEPPGFEREQRSWPGRESGYQGREPYESGSRRREGPARGRPDDRGEYDEWLQEHQGRDRGSEGDRQLEGLREEHQSHHSDQRYEPEHESGRPRSRRRFEKGDEQKENPGNRATRVRSATRPSTRTKPRTAARTGRSR